MGSWVRISQEAQSTINKSLHSGRVCFNEIVWNSGTKGNWWFKMWYVWLNCHTVSVWWVSVSQIKMCFTYLHCAGFDMTILCFLRPHGGIGRHEGLKIPWLLQPCRFESDWGYVVCNSFEDLPKIWVVVASVLMGEIWWRLVSNSLLNDRMRPLTWY